MSEVVNSDITSESYDAQQTVEEIGEGERQSPTANVEADYEASKQFSTSPIDQTEAGVNAADAATAPKFDLPEPDVIVSQLDSTGDPNDYKQMAQTVSSIPDGTSVANTDDLYKKALEKGEAGA